MKNMRVIDADPVGIAEIAQRTGRKGNTVSLWNMHGVFPSPRWYVSGFPAWDWNVDVLPALRLAGKRIWIEAGAVK